MEEREPLGSPVGFRAQDFDAALRDIDPPPPKRISASPFAREESEPELHVPTRQLRPDHAGAPEVPIAKRPVSIPSPAVAVELQQRVVTPRRFGRLSAAAVTTTESGMVHRPQSSPRAATSRRGDEVEGREFYAPDGAGVPSPRGRSAPVMRFGRLPAPPVQHAVSIESAPDDPGHYTQYAEFTEQSRTETIHHMMEQKSQMHQQQRVRGHSAPLLKPDVATPAAGLTQARRSTLPSKGVQEGWKEVDGEFGSTEGAGGRNDAQARSSGAASSSDGKKSSGSGFFSSLFRFMGQGNSRKKTPVDSDSAGKAIRGRSAPLAGPRSADQGAAEDLSQEGTQVYNRRPVPKSAPLMRDGGLEATAAGLIGPPFIAHTPISSEGLLTPRPPAAASDGQAPRPALASRGEAAAARPPSSLPATIDEDVGLLEGDGQAEEASGLRGDLAGMPGEAARETAAAGLGAMGWELFQLAKMGEMQGLQSVVLSLSVVGKGHDVVAMRDKDGMTLLHWAAREGHLDIVKYLVFEANADVLELCNRRMKPAEHAREQWWMKVARLLEAFEHNRDEQARSIQSGIRRLFERRVFGVQHMAAVNIQALVRGKLEMLHQNHVWTFSNMWFNPKDFSVRQQARLALEQAHQSGARLSFKRVASSFSRVASLPSAWGGSDLEGRHMLVAMLQAPLRRRLRAGEWEVDLPGGMPPQNLLQYQAHNATVLVAAVRRRLALIAYHTARVWLRKTGQSSHSMMANLLALGRRPLVGAEKREQEARTVKAVEHARQIAMSTARNAGWTVKDPLRHATEAVRVDVDVAISLLAQKTSSAGANSAHDSIMGTAPTSKGGGPLSQQEAVAAYLETGSWTGMTASSGSPSAAAAGGAHGHRAGAGGEVADGYGRQADLTPVFKNRAYILRRQRMRPQYESALAVAREQERIKKEVEDRKAAEQAAMHEAARLIQRIYRGGNDRDFARQLAVRRKREREEKLAATDNKLFSLYSDGTNCLCIHVEWRAEEGLGEPSDRWHAVRSNPGGVQGVVVLALRAPEVVREEKRMKAQLEAEAEAARLAAWRALVAEEQRARQDAAILTIQKCVRMSQNRKKRMKAWHGKAKVSVVERKEDEVQDLKKQLARLKTSLYAAKGEVDHLDRSIAAHRHEHQELINQVLELDIKCSTVEKARRAAISGRRHQEAGRLRVEFERHDSRRQTLKEEAVQQIHDSEDAAASKQAILATIQGINQEIKDVGKRIEILQRQLDGGLLSRAPRPPKHATTRTLLQARESRFAAGRGAFDRLRGARAAANVSSEVEVAAAARVQTVVRGWLARALLTTRRRMRHELAVLRENQPLLESRIVRLQAIARGAAVRNMARERKACVDMAGAGASHGVGGRGNAREEDSAVGESRPGETRGVSRMARGDPDGDGADQEGGVGMQSPQLSPIASPVGEESRRRGLVDLNGEARVRYLLPEGGGGALGRERLVQPSPGKDRAADDSSSWLEYAWSPSHSPRVRGSASRASGLFSSSTSPLRSSSTFSKGLKLPTISSSVKPLLSHVAE